MGRVKIKFPNENPLFETTIKVRVGDINYGGHVGNDAILSIIHEARVQFLAHYNFTELNMGGHGVIMADVMIAYKAEGFYGDVLAITIYVDEITDRTFDLLYKIQKEQNGSQVDVAHGKTGMICFDYDQRKIVEMSTALKTILKA